MTIVSLINRFADEYEKGVASVLPDTNAFVVRLRAELFVDADQLGRLGFEIGLKDSLGRLHDGTVEVIEIFDPDVPASWNVSVVFECGEITLLAHCFGDHGLYSSACIYRFRGLNEEFFAAALAELRRTLALSLSAVSNKVRGCGRY